MKEPKISDPEISCGFIMNIFSTLEIDHKLWGAPMKFLA